MLVMATGQFGAPVGLLVLVKSYNCLLHRRCRLAAGFHHKIIESAISQQTPDEITRGGNWPKS